MRVLECKNGHRVSDPDALRCPECGEYVTTRSVGSSATVDSGAGLSQPMALILGGVVLTMVAGAVVVASGGGFGIVVGYLLGGTASTLWLIGCIAMGVRIGLAKE